ncbi:hypothetical protein EJB05_46483, partial [Eragrostis curvula]
MAASKKQAWRLCMALVLLVGAVAAASTTTRSRSKFGGGRSIRPHHVQKQPHLEPLDAAGYRTYIVMLDRPSAAVLKKMDDDGADAHRAWHQSFLPSEFTSLGQPRLLSAYRVLFHGFSARLTRDEAKQLSAKPGVLRIFPNGIRYLQTTYSPSFLGLPNKMGDDDDDSPDNWPGAGGRGMIIGIVDGGIDVTHPSMQDGGFEGVDPPARWSGSCEFLKCNRKLIGLKNLYDRARPALDVAGGHGTHTASTAAGNFVANASFNGLARGNSSGVAPYAHVAIYKICGGITVRCPDKSITDGIEAAVADGVDVVSLSIGAPVKETYDDDVIAIASYRAMQKGVLVVAAGGNQGPAPSSVLNVAPWVLTVGASTVDRSFRAIVSVDDDDGSTVVFGESLARRDSIGLPADPQELLYREDGNRRYCVYPQQEVSDKIVICDQWYSYERTQQLIYTDYGATNAVVQVSYDEAQALKDSAKGPRPKKASLDFSTGTVLGTGPAPTVAGFSGRGPSKYTPAVLKPDLLAPGVNILAGLPFAYDDTDYEFGIQSGTSMAVPHVSGLVALLKRLNPTWSPAIIRSALMTTAYFTNNLGDDQRITDQYQVAPADNYAMGAGHVNISRAMDPGLAYDIDELQYARYVCTNHGEKALRTVSGDSTAACSGLGWLLQEDLNYPSVVVDLQEYQTYVTRTLTNLVYDPDLLPEVYNWKVEMPQEVNVTVDTEQLWFDAAEEQLSFTLTVQTQDGRPPVQGSVFHGSFTWTSSGGHVVRSPLVAVANLSAPQPSTAWDFND